MESIRETIRQLIVQDLLSGPAPEAVGDDTDLQESGILDSLSMLKLVSLLENQFGIVFMPEELGGDDFCTVASMECLITSKISALA